MYGDGFILLSALYRFVGDTKMGLENLCERTTWNMSPLQIYSLAFITALQKSSLQKFDLRGMLSTGWWIRSVRTVRGPRSLSSSSLILRTASLYAFSAFDLMWALETMKILLFMWSNMSMVSVIIKYRSGAPRLSGFISGSFSNDLTTSYEMYPTAPPKNDGRSEGYVMGWYSLISFRSSNHGWDEEYVPVVPFRVMVIELPLALNITDGLAPKKEYLPNTSACSTLSRRKEYG